MLWANINRDKKEWSFGVFYNAQAVALSKGDWVVFDVGTQVDGNRTIQAAATTLTLVVGVAIEDVAASDYGRFQTYGYCAEALVSGATAGGTAIAVGDALIPVAAKDYLARGAAGSTGHLLACAFAAEAVATTTTPAAAKVKVIVKTL